MKTKNAQICSNCGEENALFEKNCAKCKHYLRATVVNIDLWKTIWQLLETPTKAIKNIIWAEHKNFVFFLLPLFAIKLFSSAVTFQSAINPNPGQTEYYFYNIAILLAIYISTILIFTQLFTVLIGKTKVRFKDNFTILIYSSIPLVLSLFILTPVEYGIFGKHWFVYNPSPFMIKELLAYVLSGLEIIMLIWSFTILFLGIKTQSNSVVLASVLSVLFWSIVFIEIIYIPYILL